MHEPDEKPKPHLINSTTTIQKKHLQTGDLVPYQTFRVSSLDGAAPTKVAIDSSLPQMIPLPKGVPSYSIVAAITAVPDGGAPVAHMFRIATGEDTGDGTGAKAPPVEWTVPLMTTSQPFGCSNLTLTRSGVVPNQIDDWYSTEPGYCKGAPVALKSFSMSRAQDADAGAYVAYVHTFWLSDGLFFLGSFILKS